ncbi:cation-translocating P-type ATPase [Thomasclavelia cocleata]|uniref:Calcium-transporting ATPase n=3 Tax=Thomasclavelia cocleata TaxID=69824 RepID=A0A829ZAH0_9FIRM|nr:cation-translocating P-type ATPase [Thomasclavelia cocleata]MCI9631082.1 cation-translocating P-type ATPase [Thomasclavelia cocleata]GFI41451.1 calcium-transporting ATPase [Thomasclavelia cocleata]
MKVFYNKTITEVRKEINGTLKPISDEQVKKNQEKYGLNKLVEAKAKSIPIIFLEQFKDFLVIILISAALISGFLGDLESALVILIVITINAVLGTVQTVKAEQSLNSLKELSSPNAKVLRDGKVIEISSKEVTIGDEVYLEAGDYIPADGRIIENASMKVDESALTGESLAVEKTIEVIEGEVPLGDRTNMVYSGSFVTYGRGKFLVTGIGMETEVGRIAQLLKSTSEKKTPLQVNLDNFGKKLSIIIMAFCVLLFALNIFQGGNIGDAFMFAVALAVAAIPEALSSIVTIVLSFGTQKMAKEGAIIRKLQAVEGLGSVSIICSDKTGTLTQNKMTVEDYYIEEKRIMAKDIDSSNSLHKDLMRLSILCNDSTNIDGQEIGDPTETAMINLSDSLGVPAQRVRNAYPRLSELPFDSDRKMMSTFHLLKDGYTMITKGAVDVLIKRAKYIRKNGQVLPITDNDIKNIQDMNMEFSKNGLRVLAITYRKFDCEKVLLSEDENDLIFLGLISMMDPPRLESAEAVKECMQAGIIPIMITGDHKVTATAIAKRIGILTKDSQAVEGSEIDSLSDEQLQQFVEDKRVYARVSPEHKIRIVRAWQEKGNIVSMTGDGVNDAPALKQADIGVAMGITGSEVSKDAASMVLTDDNFATIIKAIENGRNVYAHIIDAIQFLLSGNFGGILAVLYASIMALPVPFAPVHLLFINLLTDSLPAIALGLEPHSKNVMNEKPRPMNESILTKTFLISVGIEGFVIAVMTMIAFMIGYQNGNSVLASTMAFATLCLSRLVHGYNCKSKNPVLFKKGFFNNRFLQGAFLIGFILITLVVTMPFLQMIFKVQSLNIEQLLIVYGLALANLPIIQFIKWVRNR